MDTHVDYDQVAPTYDRRYAASPMPGTRIALLALAREVGARRALEAGCGTGHWLEVLQTVVAEVCGLDLSPGMLAQAQRRNRQARLVRGRATQPPFSRGVFDLMFCVNALHHFGDPAAFIAEARRLLRPGGALAVIGADPHAEKLENWYIYQYFEGTYETDLQRFPAGEAIFGWMRQSGFTGLEWRAAEQIDHAWVGREVFTDPFLRKESTSQLTLLSDEDYAAGMQRLEESVAEAESQGKEIRFPSILTLGMWIGHVKK